jgi:hypothetical protein
MDVSFATPYSLRMVVGLILILPLYRNIWAPNRQKDLVRLLGKHYRFSARLLAIILSEPPDIGKRSDKRVGKIKAKLYQKDDVEVAASGIDTSRPKPTARSRGPIVDASHYNIARQMVHYQSVDGGSKCVYITSIEVGHFAKVQFISHLHWCQLDARESQEEEAGIG